MNLTQSQKIALGLSALLFVMFARTMVARNRGAADSIVKEITSQTPLLTIPANSLPDRTSSQKRGIGGQANISDTFAPAASQQMRDAEGGDMPKGPMVTAKESVIFDIPTGRAVWGNNEDKRWPMASISKLMSAVVAYRYMNLEERVTAGKNDLFLSREDASANIVHEGDVYTVKDLMRMMLLPSANDAADTLAAHYGRDAFIEKMNEQAREWGMDDTYYSEPTGLSVANQSTPDDLSILASRVLEKYPAIFEMGNHQSATVIEKTTGAKRTIESTNQFAGKEGFVGGKTGFTNEAEGNLLSVFRIAGNPIAIVVMGTADRFGQTQVLLDWYTKNVASR